ncbi:MAG: dTMP kinase [Candidatus Micrarchaeia archaeon]
MIVVFEGIDGSGKDTQIGLFIKALEAMGKTYSSFKFPSQKARLALSHLEGRAAAGPQELFMDFARDIESSTPAVLAAAEKTDFVIIDRYIFSTVAYQGVALGFDRALALAGGFSLARPDVVVFLEIAPELAYSRKNAQKEPDRFESDLAFQSKVAQAYSLLYAAGYNAGRWTRVDASKSPEKVHEIIIKEVVQE